MSKTIVMKDGYGSRLDYYVLEYVKELPATRAARLALQSPVWTCVDGEIFALCVYDRCRNILNVTENIDQKIGANVISGASCSVCNHCDYHQWHKLEEFEKFYGPHKEQHA